MPNWQERGIGLFWETYHKDAVNPKTGAAVSASRKRIKVHYNLPVKDEYADFIKCLL